MYHNNIRLSDYQKRFIIDNINDKFLRLCIPAKVHSFELNEDFDEVVYHIESDEFNTVPSIFKSIKVTGDIRISEKDIDKVHCIDYYLHLEYSYKEYDCGRNGTYLLNTTYRSFSTDDYTTIRELNK